MYLGCLAGANCSSIHESTNYTPNMLMLGREVRIPADLLVWENGETSGSYGQTVEKMQENLWEAQRLARQYLNSNGIRQEENYNTRIALNSYKPGDLVWYLNETRTPGKCPKLQNMWLGPFVIERKFSDLTYQISPKEKSRVVHHDKLKKFCGEDIPNILN